MTNLLLILLLLVGCSENENPLDQQYDQCIEGYDICGNCNGISIDVNSNGVCDSEEALEQAIQFSLQQNIWKLSSLPISNINNEDNRGFIYWYNPYNDVSMHTIWPNIPNSNQANTTIKILNISTLSDWNTSSNNWSGISSAFYSSGYHQENSQHLDIWLNSDEVISDNFALSIDMGYISEDTNNDSILNSEDEAVFGNIGNNILEEGEDVGLDGCTDEYETGYNTCLIPPLTYSEQYEQDCNNSGSSNIIDCEMDQYDHNKDNFSYTQGSEDYRYINGTEGNGEVLGYLFPDTEDLDNDYTPDFNNDYFTYTLYPKIDEPTLETIDNNGNKTGWKLYRIPLSSFETISNDNSDLTWEDIRTIRLLISGSQGENTIKIAKIYTTTSISND